MGARAAGLTGLASSFVSVVANSLINVQVRSFLGTRPVNLTKSWQANSMTCKNKSCEYDTKLLRTPTIKLDRAHVRYAELWSEIELPKLLGASNAK
jgi:hypothetical protein